ncbi:unnamed protein product [Moneuplotes crassus]|uniref:HNH nuclease domain-containing protein n=1 Tax=Euplotes crassus TaxID=5936 RepID=A0AAD2D2E1_EUPCR|nr:unnamed protein product [Moneuplotes crassus]
MQQLDNSSYKHLFKTDTEFKKFLEDENTDNRTFTRRQKHVCWHKSRTIIGRDPNRWKFDPVGNPVLRNLRGCFGALCHEYDHIVPYSKEGKTVVSNCQILQTGVNRFKSNKTYSDRNLQLSSKVIGMTDSEMDLMEYAVFGNVTEEKDFKPNKI